MITFPGDPAPSLRLSGAVPSAPWRQGRSRAPPAQRPHLAAGHPRASPTCLPQGLCIPSPTSLASTITRWELLSQRVSLGFPGGACVCVLVLSVQIVCINFNFLFFFVEQNKTRSRFHHKAAGGGKHSPHQQAAGHAYSQLFGS